MEKKGINALKQKGSPWTTTCNSPFVGRALHQRRPPNVDNSLRRTNATDFAQDHTLRLFLSMRYRRNLQLRIVGR